MSTSRPAPNGRRVALVDEARGEFLFLQRVAAEIDARIGHGAAIQIVQDPGDLSPGERVGCLLPTQEPAFATAMELSDAALAAEVARCEVEFGIPNLRRLWLSDLDAWRDGAPDGVMARRAVGFLRVLDELFIANPGLAGGFGEESGRLLKRAFRAVALHHGRRPVIALGPLFPGRVVFTDQEDLQATVQARPSHEPDNVDVAAAEALVASVRGGTLQFSEPRDLSLNPGRVRNYTRLLGRQVRRAQPGAVNTHLGTFTRDFVGQRVRIAVLERFAVDLSPARGAIFYPLHAARDSQITIRGEVFRDQSWIIEHLLNSVPYGVELWVKPHPAAAGQVQVSRLLALRSRHPQLRIIRPTVHAHAVIQACDAVVTVNSTTGFEALMFQRPVVTLGESLYRGAGLTTDVEDLSELPVILGAVIGRAPAPPAAVVQLLAYYHATSHEAAPIYLDQGQGNAARYATALTEELGVR